MLTKKEMLDCVYNQLAIDYNCSPDDFLKDGLIFTEAIQNQDRRPMPWRTPRLELMTIGHSLIVNASADIMPFIRKQMENKTRFEALCLPFICAVNPYYLPEIGKIVPLSKPKDFEFEIVEQTDIPKLYETTNFHNALQYDINSPRPDVLVALAKYKGEIVGMAGASADCKAMWQIGVDVLEQHRGKGLAATLVNMPTLEILNRGFIPYYSTDCSNIISQRVAIKAGYFPAWAHCYRTNMEYLK